MAKDLCIHNERQQDCAICSGSPSNKLDYQPPSRLTADSYYDQMNRSGDSEDDHRR